MDLRWRRMARKVCNVLLSCGPLPSCTPRNLGTDLRVHKVVGLEHCRSSSRNRRGWATQPRCSSRSRMRRPSFTPTWMSIWSEVSTSSWRKHGAATSLSPSRKPTNCALQYQPVLVHGPAGQRALVDHQCDGYGVRPAPWRDRAHAHGYARAAGCTTDWYTLFM